MKILGREPALWIGLLAAALSFAGTLGFRLLSPDQSGLWIIAINAVAAAVTAYAVRPISPVAFTYAIGALIALATAYGLQLTPEQVSGINGLVVPILVLLTRSQVSPVETAISDPSLNPTPEATPDVLTDQPVVDEAAGA